LIVENRKKLPLLWEISSLDNIVDLNPKLDKSQFDDEMKISFVPMPAVEAESGQIDVAEIKIFAAVKKGYTAFQENDVLFAKITPCMENGKMAIVPRVVNNVGFGSTEFHVLRSYSGISPKYIYYYVSSKLFRAEAEHNMTGAVGQRRVTAPWFGRTEIPLPPKNEQHRIVAKIEQLFSELDKGIENLKTARKQLKVYRQALLKHAFEGKFTEQWRKDNANKLETTEQLLVHIQQGREVRYQKQLDEWEKVVKKWEADSKEGKKPAKPSAPKLVSKINIEEQQHLFNLPELWSWERLGSIFAESVLGKMLDKSKNKGEFKPYLRNINVRWGSFRLDDILKMRFEDSEFGRYSVSKGDLVLCEGGEPGRCSVWENEGQSILIQKALHRVRFLNETISPYFVYYYIRFISEHSLLESYFTGTTIKHLTGASLSKLPIPVCSYYEQICIVDLLENKISYIKKLDTEIEKQLIRAEALRQSILKKAFSGQLVPQDPNDEPASELLKRIAAEKAEIESRAKVAKAATKKSMKKTLAGSG